MIPLTPTVLSDKLFTVELLETGSLRQIMTAPRRIGAGRGFLFGPVYFCKLAGQFGANERSRRSPDLGCSPTAPPEEKLC